MDLLASYGDEQDSSTQGSPREANKATNAVGTMLESEWLSFESMIAPGGIVGHKDTIDKNAYLVDGVVAYPGMKKVQKLSQSDMEPVVQSSASSDSENETEETKKTKVDTLNGTEEEEEDAFFKLRKKIKERDHSSSSGRSSSSSSPSSSRSASPVKGSPSPPHLSPVNSVKSYASEPPDLTQPEMESVPEDTKVEEEVVKTEVKPKTSEEESKPKRSSKSKEHKRSRSRSRKRSHRDRSRSKHREHRTSKSKKHRSRSRSKDRKHSHHDRRKHKDRRSRHSERKRSKSKDKDKERKRSKERKPSKSRDRKDSKSESHAKKRSRSRSKDRKDIEKKKDRKKSRSRERHRSRSKDRKRDRSKDRKKHRSKSREKRSRSRSKPKRRSRSRSRDRLTSRSRSRERLRSRSPGMGRKLTFKEQMRKELLTASKQALLEKDNEIIPIKRPGEPLKPSDLLKGIKISSGESVTPQMALMQTMAAMHKKAQELTGVEVPKYYNPAAVNPLKYAEQVQKRKLLWSKKVDDKQKEKEEQIETQWKSAFISDSDDGKTVSKFRKLMGIKGAESEELIHNEEFEKMSEEQKRKHAELFDRLDQEYQFARLTTHTQRGVGLGFSSQVYDPNHPANAPS